MINCTINGKKRSIDISPVATLRDMLLLNGNFAVRDSDDAEGFCGSDTVLLDGTPVFSNLVLAGEAEGCEIRTPDSLGNSQHLTVVQQALIDAGADAADPGGEPVGAGELLRAEHIRLTHCGRSTPCT